MSDNSLSTFRSRGWFRLQQTALKLCLVKVLYLQTGAHGHGLLLQTKFNTAIGGKRVFEAL